MNIIQSIALSIAFIPSVFASTATYIAPERETLQVEKTIWREEELFDYITTKAIESGVSESLARHIVNCEAPWKRDSEGRYYDESDAQSRLTYNAGQISRNPHWGNVGDREKSFGPWQWHTPDNNITPKEAADVELSTNKAMVELKKGNSRIWTCSGNTK